MRKLIEIEKGKDFIVCDNSSCDYRLKNEDTPESLISFINKPCPKCGENLLTEKDYEDYINFLKVTNWINKWFSWIMIFIPRKKHKVYSLHVHEGLKIEKKTDESN